MNRVALARFVRLPSGSSLQRASNCAPSTFLPRVLRPDDRATHRGRGVHRFILRARAVGRDLALAEIPKDAPHRLMCERMRLGALPEGGKLEVAFAYDPKTDTARILGVNLERAYDEAGLAFGEIPGTADLQGVVGDTVVIIDWKSGYAELPPAAESWQLGFLALAACRALGMSKATVAYWFLREDGSIYEDTATLDAFDLDGWADKVRRLVSRLFVAASLDEEAPEVSVGDWCRYCECKEACPAMGGALKQALALGPDVQLTRDRVPQAYILIELIKPRLAALEEACKTFAKEAPIDLGDGRVLAEIPKPSTEIDPVKAAPVLRREFGADVVDVAIQRVITKASLARALSPVAEKSGDSFAETERRAIKALAVGGAITETHGTQVAARKIKVAKKAS